MGRAVNVGMVMVALAPAWAEVPVGGYEVSGANPGNRGTYSGTATIEKTSDICRVVWQIGSDRYVGTGVGNDSGLALYSPSGGGWKGVWTDLGGQQLGPEIWTRRQARRRRADPRWQHAEG